MFFTTGPNLARNKFLEDFPTDRGQSASASFQSAAALNPFSLIANYYTSETLGDENHTPQIMGGGRKASRQSPRFVSNRLMSQAEAQEQAATDGYNIEIPPEGMTELKYKFLKNRKRKQMGRDAIVARGPQDLTQSAANIGSAILASVADPINVASAFIPAVGMTRWAGALVQAQGIAGKGLHLKEAAILARHSKFGTVPATATRTQRLAVAGKVGVIEGAIGAAAVEPIVFTFARRLQDDYNLQDSAFNIMFGAALGGALHIGGTAITGRVAGVPERAELFKTEKRSAPVEQTQQPGVGPLLTNDTSIETREAAFRAAAVQTMEGRPVDVEDILRSEREMQEYKRGKDVEYQRARVIQEKRQQLDAEVTRLKRKLKPGTAIEDADLAARSTEVEARIKELGDKPALPALAKERARLAQEFNDIRDLRISIKQMETIQRGGELPKTLRDELDEATEQRLNQALSTTQVNQLVIDKINAMEHRANQPPINNFDFKTMERESQRAVKQTAEEAIDVEARTVEADEEFTALVEDAEAVDVQLDNAAIKQIDEAVERVKRVNDAARAFAKCRAV